MTECISSSFAFQDLGSREVHAAFDGGRITSDGGAWLLREIDQKFRFLERFAACFTDHRDPDLIEHPLVDLLKQRVFGLCLGYEDLNDHDRLRLDPLLAVLVGKTDPLGGAPRASGRPRQSPGRQEHAQPPRTHPRRGRRGQPLQEDRRPPGPDRDLPRGGLLAATCHAATPIVLDLDATDDPLHGHQLGRFFHGYYDGYCYLPLYIFCGDHPLAAILRPSDRDAAAGCLEHVERIVQRIRQAWPAVQIVLRATAAFAATI